MKKTLAALLIAMACMAGIAAQAQEKDSDSGQKNAQQARAVLDAMVRALGGQAWLDQKNVMQAGSIAAFYQGQPNLGTVKVWQFHSWPDHDRIEVTSHRDVIQFFVGRTGWEVTYRGKKQLPQDQVDEFLRRRDHSIEVAAKVWMKDPKTILIYEGKRLAARHLADQVTLISADNEAITIMTDSQTHLPLSRSFQWRDPVYKDKNTDTEEYADYHVIDGFPTPFNVTRSRNGEMVRQFYVSSVEFNRELPADFWDVDAANARIKK